ncbi:MAG TPA: cell envelope integrity EipB family protein [Acetobacteraceae bacterium]|nr:cell envelope integrity EipB family protein [Acetobacteraceae bacterium]
MRLPALSAAVLALCVSVSVTADAAGLNTTSAAHRAIYNLTLSTSRGGDVVAARGTMGYEVIDACDGWAVRQRLSMTLTNTDGQDVEMVSDYATWEAKDGLKFRFHMKQTTDSAVTSQTDGDAKLERTGGPGEAHYTVPEDITKKLPAGTLFPMAHTSAILAAAQSGKKFLALPLFDGTDDSGAEDSFIVVLDWKKPEANKYPFLSNLPSTRVRLGFFDHESKGEVPTYQVGMRYWENGVADNLQMDFGDFVMDAKMTDLTALPHKC